VLDHLGWHESEQDNNSVVIKTDELKLDDINKDVEK